MSVRVPAPRAWARPPTAEGAAWELRYSESVGLGRPSRSPPMRRVFEALSRVAEAKTTVLVLGETGVGKEVAARFLHVWGGAAEADPFVAVNCASIPAELVESTLFGHVAGAFTGAERERLGRFRAAQGGTIFLDEVGELPLLTQPKLLRVLEQRTFEPVGSDETVKVDVRVVAATNRDLDAEVKAGRFRADLLERLRVFVVTVPPLRERLEDLEELCEVLLERQARRTGRFGRSLTQGLLARLRRHPWPGNIRELENFLERAAIMTRGQVLDSSAAEYLARRGVGASEGPAVVMAGGEGRSLEVGREDAGPFPTLAEVQVEHVRRALRAAGGQMGGAGGAAGLLGIKRQTLYSLMERLGMDRAAECRAARAAAQAAEA